MTDDYKETIDRNCFTIKEFNHNDSVRYSILFTKPNEWVQEICVNTLYHDIKTLKGLADLYCYSISEVVDVLYDPIDVMETDDPNVVFRSRVIRRERLWKKIFFVRSYSYQEFRKLHPEYFV